MIQEEKLLKSACEKCEEYSTNHSCEIQDECPVYQLYKLACKKKRIVYKRDSWEIPPPPRPEMI